MTTTLSKKAAKLKPMNDKVLIQKEDAREQSEGGIYLPTASQEKPTEGLIVAAGPGVLNEKGERKPLQVKAGDKVLYSKYSGTEIKIEGKEYIIVSEKDILAVVEE